MNDVEALTVQDVECFCGYTFSVDIIDPQLSRHNLVVVCPECGAVNEVLSVDDFNIDIEGVKYTNK